MQFFLKACSNFIFEKVVLHLMKIIIFSILYALFLQAAYSQSSVKVVNYEELEELIEEDTQNHKIFNFWATWCKPCIKELPYFEKITRTHPSDEVKVYLVSLDFVENLESRVIPFVKKKELQSEILLLDEVDFNDIINDISADWSGAIPATLFVNASTGQRYFYEKEFQEGELETIIKQKL